MRDEPILSARIKYVRQNGPTRIVRALCGPDRPALPPYCEVMVTKVTFKILNIDIYGIFYEFV